MKKSKFILPLFLMVLIPVTPVSAQEIESESSLEVQEQNFVFREIESQEKNYRQYEVIENGNRYIIKTNYQTHEVFWNDEKLEYLVEPIPISRTTVDYSSGVNLTYNIPWRGTIQLTAALLVATIPGTGWAVASAIVSAVAAEGAPLYVTCTQYRSVEQYYSSYTGSYYYKAINMNIRGYKNSISPSNLIYGPVNGDWFDPVRPS